LKRFGFAASARNVASKPCGSKREWPRIDAISLRMPEPGSESGLPSSARAWFGAWLDVPLVRSNSLTDEINGPALIVEPNSRWFWSAAGEPRRLAGGELVLESSDPARPASRALSRSRLHLPASKSSTTSSWHIAEQMGEVLKATAQSVNIKERLDYSCALFDANGGLVANAPHMPVHLGSMGASVRAVVEGAAMRPGDSWLVNSPYHGALTCPT